MSSPSYFQVSAHELNLLATHKASGATTQVYLCIAGFCYGQRVQCWPSINTIWETLNRSISKRSIIRCMAWLEDKGLLKRKSKQGGRISLIAKRASAFVDAVVKKVQTSDHPNRSATDDTVTQRNRKPKKKTFSKNRPRKPHNNRLKTSHRTRESHSSRNDAEVFETVCDRYLVGFYEHQSLSADELNAMASHRARSTSEWRHYQTHLPEFIQWAETHI